MLYAGTKQGVLTGPGKLKDKDFIRWEDFFDPSAVRFCAVLWTAELPYKVLLKYSSGVSLVHIFFKMQSYPDNR